MPYGDGSGPDGMGPMTGRRAGFCAGYDRPGYMNSTFRRGFGRGRGFRGRGFSGGFCGYYAGPVGYQGVAPVDPAWGKEQELKILRDQSEYLESALQDVKKRIENLEAKSGQKQ